MLITKEVHITAFSNPSFYEDKGYVIDKYFSKQFNRFIVKRNLKIKVKIEDIPLKSNVFIEYSFDSCGMIVSDKYSNFNIKKTSFCKKCALISSNTGENHYLYGKNMPHETKIKLSQKHNSIKKIGELHHNFKIEKTCKERDRKIPEYKNYVYECLKRDSFLCKKCGNSKKLQVHHIMPYYKHIELRLDMNNGITLCKGCHKEYHSIYGIKNANNDNLKIFLWDK